MRQKAGREPRGLTKGHVLEEGWGRMGACMPVRDDRHVQVLHEGGLREGRRRAHLQRDDLLTRVLVSIGGAQVLDVGVGYSRVLGYLHRRGLRLVSTQGGM
jgi:hypothetical protein